jgi:hypothetical protein
LPEVVKLIDELLDTSSVSGKSTPLLTDYWSVL